MNPVPRIVALAALCLVLGQAQLGFAGTGNTAAGWVPADSLGVFTLNIDRFRTSANYGRAMSFLRSRGDVGKSIDFARDELGIDPDKDVHTVLGSLGRETEDDSALIVEARFKAARVKKMLGKKAKARSRRHGVTVWTFEDGTGVALLGSHIAFGKAAGVERVIDVYKGKGKSITGQGWYRSQKKRIDTSKDAWLVLSMPASVRTQPMMGDIKGVAGSIDVASGLGLELRLTTASATTAKALEAQMRIGLTFGAKEPAIAPITKKVQLSVDGSDAKLSARLDDADLKAIAGVMSAAGAI